MKARDWRRESEARRILWSESDMPKTGTNAKYYVASLSAIFFWSMSFVATKIAYASFSPLCLGCLRFSIASIILRIMIFREKGKRIPEWRDLAKISLSGFLGITVYFALENVALSMTTASIAAMVVAVYPVITLLLETALRKSRIAPLKLFGICLSLCGMAILTVNRSRSMVASRAPFVGVGLFILAGIAWSLYNLITASVVGKYAPVTISFYQSIIGCVLFVPLAALEGFHVDHLSASSINAALFLGVFCSVLAFLLYNFGLRRISSSTSVAMMNLVTVFGVVFSVVILGERLTLLQLLGGIVIVCGVILTVKE
jgi:drug/metabolite transporter (DMT)-like permease